MRRRGPGVIGQRPFGLINPHTGQLEDFAEIPGDLPPEAFDQSNMQRWGARIRVSTDNVALGSPNAATVISTGDLGRSYPIDVQFRFALSDASTGQPVLPWSPVWPFLGGPENLLIKVRRVTDPTASFTEDDFVLQSFGTVAGATVPFDILLSRNLGIDVQFSNGGAPAETIWVEALATIVTVPSKLNTIQGWSQSAAAGLGGFVAATATPGNSLLLRAMPQRVQFSIVNTSTNADLILGFNQAPQWTGPVGNIILPAYVAGTHVSTYESPVGGFTGEVRGSWNNAAPNGGALVTEGSYF
jgi:hypothetical protein